MDVEEVDDYVGNILQERGHIGIDLTRKLPRPPTSTEKCHTWVTEQLSMRRSQPIRNCRFRCPPTLRLARRALGRGRFRTLAKDYKWNGRGFNFCFFSATWGRIDADQCCYRRIFAWDLDILQATRSEGSGHWYPYHPFRDFTKYLEDERAYQDCCSMADSTTQSCAEYYSVRPTCGVNFWFFPTTWGKLTQLYSFKTTAKNKLYIVLQITSNTGIQYKFEIEFGWKGGRWNENPCYQAIFYTVDLLNVIIRQANSML